MYHVQAKMANGSLPGPQNRTAGPGPAVRFSVYSTGSMVSMAWAGMQAAQS